MSAACARTFIGREAFVQRVVALSRVGRRTNGRAAVSPHRDVPRRASLVRLCLTLGMYATIATSCSPAPGSPYVASGDRATPIRGGTLHVVTSADVDHLYSVSAYLVSALAISQTFTRQLVTYPPIADFDSATQLVSDLGTELPTRANGGISADGLRYRFHLRSGVRWNSTPPRAVSASDFVRAIKLFCNPVSPVGAAQYYTATIAGMSEHCAAFAKVAPTVSAIRQFVEHRAIAGVRAADSLTLDFTLVAPAGDFLNVMAMRFASPVPEEYLDYLPDSPDFRQHTLSLGPYEISRYLPGRLYELTRNPVWDARLDPNRPAYVDRITIDVGGDQALSQLQVEAGTADLSFDGLLTADLAALRQHGDPRVRSLPLGNHFAGWRMLRINLHSPNNNGALKSLAVRQALALAIDKRAFVQLGGGPDVTQPMRQAVPAFVSGYEEGADRFVTPGDRGDPSRAAQLLANAGFARSVSLRLAHSTSGTQALEAQSVQASLERAGVHVELLPFAENDLYTRALPSRANADHGTWDLALVGWTPDWYGRNTGRTSIVPLYDGRESVSSWNFGLYDNPAVNAAVDQALGAMDLRVSESAWTKAASVVMDDVAVVPLIQRKPSYMLSSRVRNCVWDPITSRCNLTAVWLADGGRGRNDDVASR